MNLTSKTAQLGGAAFMLGNLLFIVNKLNEMSRLFLGRFMPDVIAGEHTLLIVIGQLALIAGYIGIYTRYAPQAGRLAKNGLRLFCGGGILLGFAHVSFMTFDARLEALFIFVVLGMLLMLPGLILFGVANLRQPLLGRWQWLPLVTGLLGFIGFFFFRGVEITAFFLVLRTLFGLGLMGMGLALALERAVQLRAAPA